MGTDIHGGIEYRHPAAGTDFYEGEPWIVAMDLWPLYDEVDYAAFGCLFGVRNDAGYRPLAAGRGLPDDLSSGLREDLELWVAKGRLLDATWVSWADLAGLDPQAGPDRYVGRLSWQQASSPYLQHRRLLPARWPEEVVAMAGPPPPGLDAANRRLEWTVRDVVFRYEPLTAGSILGTGTHWPHVFAVMKALAGRFGDDGVRLVVAFD
ncbi:hypothetical protein AB0B50_28070 [Streptomyces sp. NPDC041068]|uniref:hypothetical protein n=1 Tax=Streptomyces sp. NPDC041068 TaxID=3155130 RepID=UPI0033F8A0E7